MERVNRCRRTSHQEWHAANNKPAGRGIFPRRRRMLNRIVFRV